MGSKHTTAQILLVKHIKELWPWCALELEYKFLEDRRFRFDIALPADRIAFEVCGGTFSGGHRHKVVPDGAPRRNSPLNVLTVKELLDKGVKGEVIRCGESWCSLQHRSTRRYSVSPMAGR